MAADDSWTMATAEEGGKPLIFRIRNAPPAFARKEAFPRMLAVSWPYEPINGQGMPSQNVVEQMSQLEDLLIAAFEDRRQGFLTVVVTGDGLREWQWYAQDADQAMELVNEALGQYEPFPVEFSFQDDPEWEAYSRFQDVTA